MDISISELDILISEFKVVKNDYILMCNNIIIGIDSHFCFLKTYLPKILPDKFNFKVICVNFNDLVAFRKLLTPNDMLCIDKNGISQYDGSLRFNFSNHIEYKIWEIYNNIPQYNQGLAVKQYDNLRSNEQFESIIARKASDGASSFIIDDYCMILFSRMLPVNKSDKVSLDIMDFDNSFLSVFKISKKKDIVVYVFIRFMKV